MAHLLLGIGLLEYLKLGFGTEPWESNTPRDDQVTSPKGST